LAGQFLGRRDPRRATESVVACLIAMTGLMLVAALLFYGVPEPLLALFTSERNRPVAIAAAPLLALVAWFLPFFGVALVLNGALRGAGDTRSPLVITLIGFFAVRIPLAYFLAHESVHLPGIATDLPGMGWGVLGAWYAMGIDLLIRSSLIAWCFWRGGWQATDV